MQYILPVYFFWFFFQTNARNGSKSQRLQVFFSTAKIFTKGMKMIDGQDWDQMTHCARGSCQKFSHALMRSQWKRFPPVWQPSEGLYEIKQLWSFANDACKNGPEKPENCLKSTLTAYFDAIKKAKNNWKRTFVTLLLLSIVFVNLGLYYGPFLGLILSSDLNC